MVNSDDKLPNNNYVVEERRKFIRLNISVDVDYYVISNEQDKHPTHSVNISTGGICIIAHEKLDVGTLLKLVITIPEIPPTVHATGRVAWVKSFTIATEEKTKYDVGIEFTEISEEDRKKVKRYVFSLR